MGSTFARVRRTGVFLVASVAVTAGVAGCADAPLDANIQELEKRQFENVQTAEDGFFTEGYYASVGDCRIRLELNVFSGRWTGYSGDITVEEPTAYTVKNDKRFAYCVNAAAK